MCDTDLLATVLEITHERLLHTIELRELNVDSLASSLEILSTLGEVLPALDAGRGDRERTLKNSGERQACDKKTAEKHEP